MKNFEMDFVILGIPYRLICDEKQFADACAEEGWLVTQAQGLHDASDLEDAKIYISPLLSPTQFVQVLFHEVLHVIGRIEGHKVFTDGTDQSEAFVDGVANGLVSFIQNANIRNLIDRMLKGE